MTGAAAAYRVRDASRDDAEACAAIYAPYVRDTAITFETAVPDAEELARRIAAAQRGHGWLVVEDDARVVGYAYAGPYKGRAAYRWSCEPSVYLERGLGGRGAGRLVYSRLLERLSERGFLMAVAGMTVPNEASTALHLALGFTSVGVQRRVGWKAGRWHDVELLQRPLGAAPLGDAVPAEPH